MFCRCRYWNYNNGSWRNILGENDKHSLEELLKISFKYALAIISSIAVILIIFAPQFALLFGKNHQIVNVAIRGLRIFAFSLPLSALSYLFMNLYNATQKLSFANYIGFGHSFLFLVGSAVILAYLLVEMVFG